MIEKSRSILTSSIIFLCVVAATTVMAQPFDPPPVFVELPPPVQADTGTVLVQLGTVYSVPEGKRLAIGFITVAGTKETTQSAVGISVKTTLDSIELNHGIWKLLSADFDSSGGFGESKTVQLFADPNTDVVFRVVGDFGAPVVTWGATITGRLEPVPNN